MRRTIKAELTNICMITRADEVLVIDRVSSDWPGITFPGGHVENDESVMASVIREVKEETGLNVSNLTFCGFTNFYDPVNMSRYFVFLYKTSSFTGEIKSSSEGKVTWIKQKDLGKMKLAGEWLKEELELFTNPHLSEGYYELCDGKWVFKAL